MSMTRDTHGDGVRGPSSVVSNLASITKMTRKQNTILERQVEHELVDKYF